MNTTENEQIKILKRAKQIFEKDQGRESIKKIIEIFENTPFQKILLDLDININILEHEALIAYGKYLIRIDEVKKASTVFSLSVNRRKENPVSWYYLIKSLESLGAKNLAKEKLALALKKTKRHPALLNLKKPLYKSNPPESVTSDSINVFKTLQ